MSNLFSLFREGFQSHGSKPFLKVPSRGTVTFAQIEGQSAQFNAALRDRGVSRGDRVLVQADKSINSVALYLACLRRGAVYVPLNTAYTVDEIEYFLSDAKPALLVCRPDAADSFSGVVGDGNVTVETMSTTPISMSAEPGTHGTGTLDTLAAELAEDQSVAGVEPDELAAMLYTSGTTGSPKGAMLSHRNLAANAQSLCECWQWRRDDVLLHALPIFHVHGLFVALHCALLGPSTVVFLPRFDVAAVRAALAECTVMMGVPTFYVRLLADEGFNREEAGHMRLFISGSAPLTEQTAHSFFDRTGHALLERYGMSETGITVSNPVDGERIAGTVGFAVPGVEVRVADDQGEPVPVGQVGTIEVRGSSVFPGYWGQPEKTAAEFRKDGFFITGDLGSLDEEGRLSIVGRGKDLIISGGYNVYPKEIETCIDDIEGVVESAVIGVPHSDFGEAVVAVVVPESASGPSEAIIRDGLSTLARFKHPKTIIFRAALPRNAMGKVQKNLLREEHRSLFNTP